MPTVWKGVQWEEQFGSSYVKLPQTQKGLLTIALKYNKVCFSI